MLTPKELGRIPAFKATGPITLGDPLPGGGS